MRELNCLILPDSQGWSLFVGTLRRGSFPSKGGALRAAILEAQRVRAAGFYSSVKVRHGTSAVREPVRTDDHVGGTHGMPTTAGDLAGQSVRPL